MPEPQRKARGGGTDTQSPRIESLARDLVVLAACAVLGFVIGARLQVFEVFERWVEAHEAQEVDEIFAMALFLLPGFVLVSFWRRRELRRDIAARLRAEERVREAETRYRTLVEQIPAIVYIDEPDENSTGYVSVYMSPQVTTILGYEPEEFVSDPGLWERVLHPEDRERALAADARFYATGEMLGQQYRLIARDGRTVWVRDHAALLRDDHGGTVLAHGVLFDITGQKEAEETLRKAEQRYRSLVEQIPAITYLDVRDENHPRGYRTIYVSPQVESLLGFEQEELTGDPESWDRLIHPDDLGRVLAEDAAATVSLTPWSVEYRMIARDGRTVWVRDHAVVLDDAEGRPAYWHGVIFDITERKQAEEELRRYSDKLERANEALKDRERDLTATLEELRRVEAERRRLLDRTVHATEEERRRIAIELHDGPIQHLTALDYNLETMRRRQGSGGDRQLAGEALDRTQERLRADIGELRRMMASLRPPVLDDRGLEAALRDHVDTVSRESGIECRLEADLPTRLGSAVETVLYRVVQEALRNVIKHASAHHALVTLHEEGGCVVLDVRDDGVGFQPEATIDASVRGRFGLIGMRERVEMIGGTWEILSAPGSGTRVRAVVPRGGSEASGVRDQAGAHTA